MLKIEKTDANETMKTKYPWFYSIKHILIKCGMNDLNTSF